MQERLNAIKTTLNLIEVHGAENMSRLLGCIMELDRLIENTEVPNDDDDPTE